MYTEFALSTEQFSALNATVRPYSKVYPLMYLQDTLCVGGFVAYIAKVWQQSIFTSTMLIRTESFAEVFLTDIELVKNFFALCMEMSWKVTLKNRDISYHIFFIPILHQKSLILLKSTAHKRLAPMAYTLYQSPMFCF
jgi:hypothetical protein